MYRLTHTIWLLLFLNLAIDAQDQVDFNTIDTETYRLFQEQKWDSVTAMGKEALKQDIDYYYLRMRIGIALYNQKNYRKASTHFTKALTKNQGDAVALEYLYFSRLLSGKTQQANLVRKQFKGSLAIRLPSPKGKFFDQLGVETLYSRGMIDMVSSNLEESYPGLPPGLQYLSHHFSNLSLSLVNNITPGFSLVHNYSYLTKTSHHYYNEGTTAYYLTDQNVSQHQYYLSPRISTASDFTIMPMFHLIKGKFQVPATSTPGPGGFARFSLFYRDFINYAGGVGLIKGIGAFDLSLGAYFAGLNKSSQVQNRIGLTWYPKGNLSIYAGGYMNSQYETTEGVGVLRLIPEMQFGFSISEKVWFDLNGTFGDMTNYLENNGMIVYNSFSEFIEKKIKLSISIPVTKKGSMLYMGGRWTSNRSEFFPFEPESTGITNTYIYNVLSFYGGISWKF